MGDGGARGRQNVREAGGRGRQDGGRARRVASRGLTMRVGVRVRGLAREPEPGVEQGVVAVAGDAAPVR
jgi:hypothetical protein